MKIGISNPVLSLLVFPSLLGPRQLVAQPTKCPRWCEKNEKPNEIKCSWGACSGCSFCTAACPRWCERNEKPDEVKCGWADCSGCAFCSSNPCPGWCERNEKPIEVKCSSFKDCFECPFCTSRPKRPNILLLLGDDIGTGDVPGYWGNENDGVVDMPNLHELVKKGTLFTDAHATPVCATSRYVLLSGNYQHRGRSNGGTWLMGQPSQFLEGQQSIAQVLRDGGGYHTAMMGKWHLGGLIPAAEGETSTTENILRNPRNDWSKPLVQGPQTLGFDSSLITDKGIQSTPYCFFQDGFLTTAREDVRYWRNGTYDMPFGKSKIISEGQGDVGWDSTAYNMILVNETNCFLDDHFENRPNDPFFAYVALGEAHIPHSPPDRYIDGEPVAGETPTHFLDMLKEMDMVVGDLVKTIEKRGIAKDTIFIFTSDNGGLAPAQTKSEAFGHFTQGPLNSFKGTIAEGGHRVPFIIRHDGVFPAGEERTHLVGINDIFATLCEIAGIDIPSGSAVDSVSFADYIVSDDNKGLREFLGIWKDTRAGETKSWSIRYNNYKLNHYLGNGVTTLHDLDNDIGETYTLHWDPQYEELIQTMRDEMNRLRPE